MTGGTVATDVIGYTPARRAASPTVTAQAQCNSVRDQALGWVNPRELS